MVDLNGYKQCIENIRRYASEHDVSEAQMTEIFNNCFRSLETKYKRNRCSNAFGPVKLASVILFLLFAAFAALCHHRTFNSLIVRNLQTSIYPGLKILRKLAVPVISQYPSLSELYDEWCLLENPFFYIGDMDCWPCSVVHSVPDLTGQNITRSFNTGIPYTKSEKNVKVDMKDLVDMYWNNRDVFDQDAKRVSSNNVTYKTVRDVMSENIQKNPSESLDTHVSWRVNRMKPGRVIRKLFPKPSETPTWWGQSIEKFIFIDEPKSRPYSLPNPECSNVFIRFTSGARLIKMIPSSECMQNCRTSTILLSEGHTLWYNWWYWRPISLPVPNSTAISISYLTSFC